MIDEHRNLGISGLWDKFLHQDEQNVGLYDNHVAEKMVTGQRGDPGSSPARRRCQPLSNLSNSGNETKWEKDLLGPLRTSGITCWSPIARGGANVPVYARPCASPR
jgi:hypothetical protein